LSAYLLAGDVALLPYTDGASPRRGSLLACAEHGLPIVSTLPAAAEVADAVQAVEPDPGRLAEAVLDLAHDPAHAARLRTAAHALAARTAWPRIAATHVQLYERLLVPVNLYS
ncbi:MAG: glycosyl transferase family 1, partial [Chloroflexi bacterium]|nr:glycosyl transferase family 1 [Chloroflexota bacterium]